MKRLQLLGLMLMAVFAFGSTVVASASATERGVLTLKETGTSVEATGENVANKGTLTAGTQSITCKKLNVLSVVLELPGKGHFNLADKDADIHFSECEAAGIKCNSEEDGAGVILLRVLTHLINMLDKAAGKLVAGVAFLVLDSKLAANLLILCGVLHITVRGVSFGLIDPLNAKKEITLTEKVKHFTVTALKEHVCDKENETVCDELGAKPLEANFGAGFVAATEVTEAYLMLITPEVLWDD
jgi:hypothetical protein